MMMNNKAKMPQMPNMFGISSKTSVSSKMPQMANMLGNGMGRSKMPQIANMLGNGMGRSKMPNLNTMDNRINKFLGKGNSPATKPNFKIGNRSAGLFK